MNKYRMTYSCEEGYLAGDYTIYDREVTKLYGISRFVLEKLQDSKWIVVDECSGWPANAREEDFIVEDPDYLLDENWRDNCEYIDTRPDGIWSYESSNPDKYEIIEEFELMKINKATKDLIDNWKEARNFLTNK